MNNKCGNCGHHIRLIDLIISPNMNHHICSRCGNRYRSHIYTLLSFIFIVIINFVLLDGISELIGFILIYLLCWPFLNLMFGFRK